MLARINIEAAQGDLKITTKKTYIPMKMGAQQSKIEEVIRSGDNFNIFKIGKITQRKSQESTSKGSMS